jgi:hypothetical protein
MMESLVSFVGGDSWEFGIGYSERAVVHRAAERANASRRSF